VDAVEAHGTGTRLGDPIEAQALLATYGQDRAEPLWLGSVKSNIGHAQAAAGVSGVIKMVLAIGNGVLPPTLHVDIPTPHVDWSAGAVRLLTEGRAWQPDRPRRGAVSSFGLSGTNAHVILEQAPEEPAGPDRTDDATPLPFVLSARDADTLAVQAGRLAAHLGAHPDLDLAGIGRTLATGRPRSARRATVIAEDHAGLLAGLTAIAAGETPESVVRGVAGADRDGVVFVFPGQGSQWAGMATELLDTEPVFAERMRECAAALAPHVDWSLLAVLRGDSDSWLSRVDVVQPVLWATMVSLAALWADRGVRPAAVIGHSQGEIAAACVAGALSLDDAATVVALRAAALTELAGTGAMASVALPAERVRELLRPGLDIAAVNGPATVVVSGDLTAMTAFEEAVTGAGGRVRRIAVDYASHSSHVETIRERVLADLADIEPRTPEVPFHSTVLGEPVDGPVLDADYWYRNLRSTVRFEEAVRAVLDAGRRVFVEVSPHPVLTISVQETAGDTDIDIVAVGTLRRDDGGSRRVATALAELHVHGVPVDLDGRFDGARRVDLPTTAFRRTRYWLDAPAPAGDVRAAGLTTANHPLLTAVLPAPDADSVVLTGLLSLATHRWLADHDALGTVLLPGTSYVELAIRAGEEVGCDLLEELTIEAVLPLPATGGVRLQVRVGEPDGAGRRDLTIHSRVDGAPREVAWTLHATGVLAPGAESATFDFAAGVWPPAGADAVDITGVYDYLTSQGYHYGPMFRGLRGIWLRGAETFAEVALPEEAVGDAVEFRLHPSILDAALSATDFMAGRTPQEVGGTQLPFAWTGVTLHAAGAARLRVRITSVAEGAGSDSVRLELADPAGLPVATVRSLVVRPVTAERVNAALLAYTGLRQHESLYRIGWQQLPLGAAVAATADGWAVLGDDRLGLGDGVTLVPDLAALETVPPVVVYPVRTPEGVAPVAVRAVAAATLAVLREWLADERFADATLLVLTEHAVPVVEHDGVDLAQAPVWGVLRSAQEENPGRFALADTDGSAAAAAALPALLRADVPEASLRGATVRVPRLARVAELAAPLPSPWPADSTVLVTGGTGGLGAIVARHLVTGHQVGNLVLTSRRGLDAPGARDLHAELTAAGAAVTVVPCDVADRDAVAALLAEHPVTAVVHAAGAMDNALVGALTEDQVEKVLRPKVDGAWHLHELTADRELTAFVLFSSCAGLLVSAGQANYAAANRFLDALAVHRRAEGLSGSALAFGLWTTPTEMGGGVTDADLTRLGRLGMPGMTDAEGLALLDAALTVDEPVLVPIRLDATAPGPVSGEVPLLLRDVLTPPVRRPTRVAAPRAGVAVEPAQPLPRRLAPLGAAERERVLLDLVRTHVAAVRHDVPESVDPTRGFTESGLDSLAAIDLRNRLQVATELRLPATLMFDYPNPGLLASFLLTELLPDIQEPEPAAAGPDDDSLRRAVAAIPVAALRAAGLLTALLRLAPADGAPSDLQGMDIDDLVRGVLAADGPN
jgi:acyl transferase domain-containing protein